MFSLGSIVAKKCIVLVRISSLSRLKLRRHKKLSLALVLSSCPNEVVKLALFGLVVFYTV